MDEEAARIQPADRSEVDRPPAMCLPWVESPFFNRELAQRPTLNAEQRGLATSFHEQGFVALPQVVDHDLCDRVRHQVEPMFENEVAVANRRVKDAWRSGADAVRELAVLPAVQEHLRVLYERRPIPFQTLDFKWGTEQRGHSDSIHFSCIPARFMCGVWVALEDVDGNNGPLFYYPGSQALPEVTGYDLGFTAGDYFYLRYEEFQQELMAEMGITPVEFRAHKGDALIWSSNVVHGGRPIRRPSSTRWSQVTHYFFEGCIYYQPLTSEIPTGRLRLLDVVDLTTLEPAKHSYNGRPITGRSLTNRRSRIRFEDDPDPHFWSTAPGSGSWLRRTGSRMRDLVRGTPSR